MLVATRPIDFRERARIMVVAFSKEGSGIYLFMLHLLGLAGAKQGEGSLHKCSGEGRAWRGTEPQRGTSTRMLHIPFFTHF